MVALDIYQALREDRPYRTAMDHNQALKIMKSMSARGKIDQNIVADIESLFVTPIDSDSDAANFI